MRSLDADARQRALDLIDAAFTQAAQRQNRPVRGMALAVLNNRLLSLTQRRFDPTHYGAPTIRALMEMLVPDIRVEKGRNDWWITRLDASPPVPAPSDAIAEPSHSLPTDISTQRGRVREDLWEAIVDYTSRIRYVWDFSLGRARPEEPGDSLPVFPTLTSKEMDRWREEFIQDHQVDLSGSDLALTLRWREQGLGTHQLPLPLQSRWTKSLSRRVRQRLHHFFSTLHGRPELQQHPDGDSSAASVGTLEEQIFHLKEHGNFFAIGELIAASLTTRPDDQDDVSFSRMVAAWASTKGPYVEPTSIADLTRHLESVPNDNAAVSLVNAMYRFRKLGKSLPPHVGDLAFKLRTDVESIYDIQGRRTPLEVCTAAVARLEAALSKLETAASAFCRTTPATAKAGSADLLKLSHGLSPLLVPSERAFLRDLEVLVGPAFRKLCEAHERGDDADVLRRAPEFQQNVKSHTPDADDPRLLSAMWQTLVQPILEHVAEIVLNASSMGEAALSPSLGLRNPQTKADLRQAGKDIELSFALRNTGKGHAHDVSLQSLMSSDVGTLSLVEPVGPFDLDPESEHMVRVRLVLASPTHSIRAPLRWLCVTTLGKQLTFEGDLLVGQQVTEPDWDALVNDPPYTLNPISRPEMLYGRTSSLLKLTVNATSGSSTFVWGQKRIGKTSLLQVLSTQLAERPNVTCVFLRMGELASLHEGQLARRIAERLVERSGLSMQVPAEADFGSGLGRLIPFIELLVAATRGRKFVVIIDEFDDLDPSFYTGERGRQFVKALRSVSEVGLTFFFVGSERMEVIYQRHRADLNKWTNIHLDRIDGRGDCRALITRPVEDAIEFSSQAVDFIIDYCAGHPFHMQNFCRHIFDRCLQEHRTFVDDNDTNAVRQQLLRGLGPTNFSHLWEDNPVLDALEKRRATAENCIALACIAVLGGRYENVDDLVDVQAGLPVSSDDRAQPEDLRRACERLRSRGVLSLLPKDEGVVVDLQIFREWLAENAVPKLVPIWTEFRATQRRSLSKSSRRAERSNDRLDSEAFIIPEDDIIAVSQNLFYCNRQKDVADVRSWLRQFNDDARIEIAFLLLKRLADKGFVSQGARNLQLGKVEEMIRARRLEVGAGTWKIERGRSDNMCITYVDSELKSGASVGRDLRNNLRPGRFAAPLDLGPWMKSHAMQDPLVFIVDDFAGTGVTLSKGLRRFSEQIDPQLWNSYVAQGRISVFTMFAFPEAIERIRETCPGAHVLAATTLGDDLRGCAAESGIFSDEADLRFAKEFLLQIGRELYPDAPLGFGDLGALFAFHNTVPNNTLPIFWSNGRVGEKPWKPLFPRA